MKKTFIAMLIMSAILSGCCSSNSIDTPSNSNNAVIEAIYARRSIRKYQQTPVSRDILQTLAECGVNAPNAMNAQNWEVRIVDNSEFVKAVPGVYDAPALICIAVKPGAFTAIDCGLMSENIMLAAQSMGLGTCCLGMPLSFFNSEEGAPYLEKLGFSPEYELSIIISVGYADQAPDAKPRNLEKIKFID